MRTAVFLHLTDMYHVTKHRFNNKKVDFTKLTGFLGSYGEIVRAEAFALVNPDRNHKDASFYRFLKEACAFDAVATFEKKEESHNGTSYLRGSCNVAMCVAIMRRLGTVDQIIVMTTSDEFIPLFEYCQSVGVTVILLGVEGKTSNNLVNAATRFIKITENLLKIEPEDAEKELPLEASVPEV